MAGVPMTADIHGLGCRLVHGPSGTGMRFSPTDLVGAALASCALSTMALAAQREGLPFGNSSPHPVVT